MDNIQLRARLDAIEERLGVLEGDGGRFPSHGTRGSLSRPIVDGGIQPRDVHKLNDVPVDRDDDLSPEGDDDQVDDDQALDDAHAIGAGDTTGDHPGVDDGPTDDVVAARQARSTAARKREATAGSRAARKRTKNGRGRR